MSKGNSPAAHAQRLARVAQRSTSPGPSGYGGVQPPWTDRTTTSHPANGAEWAVTIDWAERSDGSRVPASVTLSSLGGTLTDAPAPDAEPEAVTRALVESIPWGTLLWESRDAARRALPSAPRAIAYSADQRLVHVRDLYLSLGGESNRTIAQDVHRELTAQGVTVKPRKNNPEGILTEQRVREWIREARLAGLIPEYRKRATQTPDANQRRTNK